MHNAIALPTENRTDTKLQYKINSSGSSYSKLFVYNVQATFKIKQMLLW